MNNNLENKEILSEEFLEVIDEIIKYHPNVVFGGSIALNAVGLINRKVGDIDLFFKVGENPNKNNFLVGENNLDVFSDTVTDINGIEIKRTGMKMKNIKICCFNIPEEELKFSRFKFLGREISIHNINYAIIAKMTYANKNNKHKEDLKEAFAALNNLF